MVRINSDKIMGFECGADDYITKPFNLLELKARVRAPIPATWVNSSTFRNGPCSSRQAAMSIARFSPMPGSRRNKGQRNPQGGQEKWGEHPDLGRWFWLCWPGLPCFAEELLYCTLLPSHADACNILAVAVDGSIEAFVDHMNRRGGGSGKENDIFS